MEARDDMEARGLLVGATRPDREAGALTVWDEEKGPRQGHDFSYVSPRRADERDTERTPEQDAEGAMTSRAPRSRRLGSEVHVGRLTGFANFRADPSIRLGDGITAQPGPYDAATMRPGWTGDTCRARDGA
jgi:hypothetical protein